MLRKSARVLIGTAIVEFALLALLVSQFGVSLTVVIALVVGGTALGVLLSMRQVGQLFGPARRPAPGSASRSSASRPSAGRPSAGQGPAGGSAAGPDSTGDRGSSAADFASSVSDGAMRAIAGLFLAFPGLLTGLVGLLLLVPPVRHALKPVVWRWFSRLVPVELRNVGAPGQHVGGSFQDLFGQGTGSNPFGPGPGNRRPRRGDVVDVDVASTEPDPSGNPSSAPPELR